MERLDSYPRNSIHLNCLKKTLLVLQLLLIITQLSAQSLDSNWLIRDTFIRAGDQPPGNLYEKGIVPTNFYITGVTSPSHPKILLNDSMRKYERHFFVIFDDGSFGNYVDTIPTSSPEAIAYNLNDASRNVKYMYVTYIYEDDRPTKFKVSSEIPNTYQVHSIQLNHFDNIVHQDIKQGDDILVIAHKYIQSTVNSNTVYLKPDKICYKFQDSIVDPDALVLIPTPINVNNTSTNLFEIVSNKDDTIVGFAPIQSGSGEKCIFITNNDPSVNHFYNFTCQLTDEAIGKTVIFTATNSSSGISKIQSVSINKVYHDPNYFEVQCIWQENGEYWGRFHVECFNDGDTSVSELSMSMYLAANIDLSTILLDSFSIGCNKGRRDGLCIEKDLSSNYLRVWFPKKLWAKKPKNQGGTIYADFNEDPGVISAYSEDNLSPCNFTAWFEFCAKINIDQNTGQSIHNIDLKPAFPLSHFEDHDYPIMKFKDSLLCEESFEWIVPSYQFRTKPLDNHDSIRPYFGHQEADTLISRPMITSHLNPLVYEMKRKQYSYCTEYKRPIRTDCEKCLSCNWWCRLKRWVKCLLS